MSLSTEDLLLTIPISRRDRETAWQLAQQHKSDRKQKQVYLNTLAILVVHHYLEILNIPNELESSESWNHDLRSQNNVADLKITNIGHLECLPLRTGDRTYYIPPSTRENRIGYVVVEVDNSCRDGKLLGFASSISQQPLLIEQLQPLDALLVRLHQAATTENLSGWFKNVFGKAWQTIEELFDTSTTNPAWAFRVRSSSDRSKNITQLVNLLETSQDEEIYWTAAETLWTIDPDHPATGVRRVKRLEIQTVNDSMTLMVAILPKKEQKFAILLRVYPNTNQFLPIGFRLAKLNAHGDPELTAVAGEKDIYIQLKFSGDHGENFSVVVGLHSIETQENFVI